MAYFSQESDGTQPHMPALKGATVLQNAKALVCPCCSYGSAIGYLRNKDSMDGTSCCIWGSIVCAGIAGSSISSSIVAAAAGTQVAQALYALFCIGYYIPHCICGLPLSLEMRAREGGLTQPPGCSAASILETAFCPCCVLASVEKWAQSNKGKVALKQQGGFVFPPMELIQPPSQFTMQD